MDKLTKIQGALIGGAIGDAIGFIVEKKPIVVVQEFANTLSRTGEYTIPFRTYPKDYEFGQYSDDTQFSKLLILAHLEQKPYLQYLLADFKSDKLIGLGKNTRTILSHYLNKPDEVVEVKLLDNISNGSLMRTGVVGLLYHKESELKYHSRSHSQLTHNTPDALNACELLSSVVSQLIEGINPHKIVEKFSPEMKHLILKGMWTHSPEELRKEILKRTDLAKEWQGVPPLAQDTLHAALVSFMKFHDKSYKELLIHTLSLGGDTDSTCSIAGALWGACNGVDKIDAEFRYIIHDHKQFNEAYFMTLGMEVLNYRNK